MPFTPTAQDLDAEEEEATNCLTRSSFPLWWLLVSMIVFANGDVAVRSSKVYATRIRSKRWLHMSYSSFYSTRNSCVSKTFAITQNVNFKDCIISIRRWWVLENREKASTNKKIWRSWEGSHVYRVYTTSEIRYRWTTDIVKFIVTPEKDVFKIHWLDDFILTVLTKLVYHTLHYIKLEL